MRASSYNLGNLIVYDVGAGRLFQDEMSDAMILVLGREAVKYLDYVFVK
jgi:hypothetical protein